MVEMGIFAVGGLVVGVWVGYLWGKSKMKKQCEEDQELFRLNLTREKKALQREINALQETLDKQPIEEERIVEVLPKEVGVKPEFLDAPQGEKDDLKKISGIGPKLEEKLNHLGIYHYHQIALFSKDNIIWIDDHLAFKGRIERDNWVGQAQGLSKGEEK
jgi:predicted flap endonuclease-1-like 5' DNA nuclease